MTAIGVAGSCNPNHTPCWCASFSFYPVLWC